MSYYHEASLDFYRQNQLATTYPNRFPPPPEPWNTRILVIMGWVSLFLTIAMYMYRRVIKAIWAMKHSIMNEMRDSFMSELERRIAITQNEMSECITNKELKNALKDFAIKDDIEAIRKDILLLIYALNSKMGSDTSYLRNQVSKSEISQA